MKKHLSEDKAIILFSAGAFGAMLIIGGLLLYGFDKIF